MVEKYRGEFLTGDGNSRSIEGRSSSISFSEIQKNSEEEIYLQAIKILNRLWPETHGFENPTSQICQGRGGNCYALAALDALKRNKYILFEFLQRISEVPSGGWDVQFYNEMWGCDQIIHVRQEDLFLETSITQGSLGDRIVERALQSFETRKRLKKDGKLDIQGRTNLLSVSPKDGRLKYPWEGGYAHEILFSMLGPHYEKHEAIGQAQMVEALHFIGADQKLSPLERRIAANVSTKQFEKRSKIKPSVLEKYFGKLHKKVVYPNFLQPNHAYSLISVDHESGFVFISNPHDTLHTFKVDFKLFFEYFNRISYVQRRTSEPNPEWVNKTVHP